MRLRWRPFDRDEAPLGAIYGVVLAACAGIAAIWIRFDLPRMICPLREVTGLPCPTCGSTRLVEALLGGDAPTAFASNPLVFLTLAGLAAWAAASTTRRLFAWPAPELVCSTRDRVWIRIVAVTIVATGWIYVVLQHHG